MSGHRSSGVEPQRREVVERLKIACLSTGVRIDRATLASLGGDGALTVHEYPTTGGITVVVDDVYINAPFDEPFCDGASVELVRSGGQLVLVHGREEHLVDAVLPLPGYLDRSLANGRPVADLVMSHADRARLSPIAGCAYDCRFCNLPAMRYERRGAEELLEALGVAIADEALGVRHVLISGGSPGPAHVPWFIETSTEVIRRSPLPVDVMFSAQDVDTGVVEALIDAGVDSVSINMEVYSTVAAERHIPLKARFSTPHFDDVARRAVDRLGTTGRVRSLIIPGLEEEDATIAGIEHLAGLGVVPVLSPFRPSRDISLATHPPVTEDSLRRILDAARTVVADHALSLGPPCGPCQHNTLTFPWDPPRAHDATQ